MKGTEIKLDFNYGYKWFSNKNIYVKGYVFDKDDTLYDNNNLINYFSNVRTGLDFETKLKEANGIFSVIIRYEKKTFIAVDRTRTFPLFYYKNDRNNYVITDNAYIIIEDNEFIQISQMARNEFLSTGYVTGEEALFKGIFQLQAGEYIVLDESFHLNKGFYSTYLTSQTSGHAYEQIEEEFLTILNTVFNRLIIAAKGKTILVPLSGGYDSRLIVSMLKKLGYDNVICYTYGKQNSFEVKISQQVAKALGYKWCYIQYNKRLIKGFTEDNVFQKYYRFASNLVSLSHIQDYFAVKYLYENQLIPNDSIFVPGHTGDFISGGHIDDTLFDTSKHDINNVIQSILNRHCLLNKKLVDRQKFYNKQIHQLSDKNEFSDYIKYENWELKERQSKFIINANRIYEYFGYKHMIPLWDVDIVNFFMHMDIKYKENKKFYDAFLQDHLFIKHGINFKQGVKKITIRKSQLQSSPSKVKDIVKFFVPMKLLNTYRLWKQSKDDINSTQYMVQVYVKDLEYKDFELGYCNLNECGALWYIEKLHKQIEKRRCFAKVSRWDHAEGHNHR